MNVIELKAQFGLALKQTRPKELQIKGQTAS